MQAKAALLAVIEPHYLVREDDRAVFGDKGYVNNKFKRAARKACLFWGVSLKASKQHPLTEANKRFTHKMSAIRARVEHVFCVIKRQLGYTKCATRGSRSTPHRCSR